MTHNYTSDVEATDCMFIGQGGNAPGNQIYPRYPGDDPDFDLCDDDTKGLVRIRDPYEKYGNGIQSGGH